MGVIDVWNTDGQFKAVLKGHEILGFNITLAFSPDSRYLVSGAMDRQVIVWNMKTYGRSSILKNIADSVSGVAVSPDGQYLVSAAGSTIQFWRLSSGSPLCTIKGHRGKIVDIYFSPDGLLLISQSEDGTARVWGVQQQ